MQKDKFELLNKRVFTNLVWDIRQFELLSSKLEIQLIVIKWDLMNAF